MMTSRCNNVTEESNDLIVRLDELEEDSETVESAEGMSSLGQHDISQKYFLKRAGSGGYNFRGNFSAGLYEDIFLTLWQTPLGIFLRAEGRERHFFHPHRGANQSYEVRARLAFVASDGSELGSTQVRLTKLKREVTSDTNLRELTISTRLDVSGVQLTDVESIRFLGQVPEKIILGWKGLGHLDSENILPPPSILTPASPNEGTSSDQAKLRTGKTIEGAAKLYSQSCSGGQRETDNCAHFLSDALILAGFSDLAAPHSCVTARCKKPGCTAVPKRPIRAKDMQCWFKENAKTTTSDVKRNSGFWAVYQERPRDGQGHVVILDANAWKFYGTAWFEAGAEDNWKHEYYQW